MEAVICTQGEAPRFDVLPTYKITCYPLEKRDYKPFAQGQLCLTPGQLCIRLWAFEARPRPQSMLECVLTTRQSQGMFRLAAWAEAT